jgi:CspA family cold shock protein
MAILPSATQSSRQAANHFQHDMESTNVSGMQGIVKWYDETRGFGFIGTDSGDIFVHASNVPFGYKLAQGDAVEFDIVPDKKGGRNKATNVRAVL